MAAMFRVSLLSVVLACLLHLAGSGSVAEPISLELSARNPLAWALILSLCAVVALLARRLLHNGHVVRTALLLLAVPGLLMIAFTDPASELHLTALAVVVTGATLWFTIMGANYEDRLLIDGATLCLFSLPILGALVPGLAEKAFVLYVLAGANRLYYDSLLPEKPGGPGRGSRRPVHRRRWR